MTEETRDTLRQLKDMYYSEPEKTWIMDFEFITMPAGYSPIPLQLAIRQIDGKLFYSGNVDYAMSMKDMICQNSSYVSDKHQMMSTLFLRCYGALKTNGEPPSIIRKHIMYGSGYEEREIQLLSWFSSLDMQCFFRILSGEDGLIQAKLSHKNSKNFQSVGAGFLCRRLFPHLPSSSLENVHRYITNGAAFNGNYHSAVFDTEAMADIISALVKLV